MSDSEASSLNSDSFHSVLSETGEAMTIDQYSNLSCYDAGEEYRNFLRVFLTTRGSRQQIDNIIKKMNACHQSTKIVQEFIKGILIPALLIIIR